MTPSLASTSHAAPISLPQQVLQIIAYTAFGIVATVLAFVFIAPLGVLLAALVMWRGFAGVYGGHNDTALQILSLIGFTLFATVATVMAFVFLAPAGLLIAGLALVFGFGGWQSATISTPQRPSASSTRPSGNTAFDAYRTETLRRLEQEQDSFEAFLIRLRDAKDQTEFDSFMDARAQLEPPADRMNADAT